MVFKFSPLDVVRHDFATLGPPKNNNSDSKQTKEMEDEEQTRKNKQNKQKKQNRTNKKGSVHTQDRTGDLLGVNEVS